MAKQKFYVVWKGVNPGVYDSWIECKLQINGFDGAIYKSFSTKDEAEEAYASSPYLYIAGKKHRNTEISSDVVKNPPIYRTDTVLPIPLEVQAEAMAVDAACSGNPGPMEYRGIYLRTGQVAFHFGPVYGTNNIGEFLAIVHALALLKQKGSTMPVYSDSRNAMIWVRQKKCKTKLEHSTKTDELYNLIHRAETWLKNNDYVNPIIKWDTEHWGEVPADFGRK